MARATQKSPAAGTVVTEMKTPTSALLRPAVVESTPAAPASTATTSDQWSGRQMKPVSGRGAATVDASNQPTATARSDSRVVTAMARANPRTSRPRARAESRGRPRASPTDRAATALNSGPTTMAPTTRIAESVTTATDAISVARQRKA